MPKYKYKNEYKNEYRILEREKSIRFIDMVDFSKKFRALRKYCPRSHKYLCFEVLRNLPLKEEGKYSEKILTDPDFEDVYGPIELIYSIQNKRRIIEDIYPSQFLLDGYKTELRTYKGLPYRDNRDKFKIEMIMRRKEYANENQR